MTLTQLRLECLSLEMQSLVDRTVQCEQLREIVEYCVPRRLLRTVFVRANKGWDTMMRLQLEIDYKEHDRQITLSGDGLPDGIAGRYAIGDAPRGDHPGAGARLPSCPRIGKAIELFTRIARDRGLYLDWDVSFVDRHEELHKMFLLPFPRDLTYSGHRKELTHTLFPELKVVAAVAPDIVDSFEEKGSAPKRLPGVATCEDERK
jgi:hypothetical protein